MALSLKKDMRSSVYYNPDIIKRIQSLIEEETGSNDESMGKNINAEALLFDCAMVGILEIRKIDSQPVPSRDMDQRRMMINHLTYLRMKIQSRIGTKEMSDYMKVLIPSNSKHTDWIEDWIMVVGNQLECGKKFNLSSTLTEIFEVEDVSVPVFDFFKLFA